MATENMSSDVSQGYLDLFLNNNNVTEHSEKVPKLCPLCNSPIRLYFIHFNEKFLMCEKTTCAFPFGYEDLQFVREKVEPGEEYGSMSGSQLSESTWAANSVLSNLDEDSLLENTLLYKEINEIPFEDENITKQKTLDKSLKDIKELQEKYNSLDSDEVQIRELRCIKNEKWINKLGNLQSSLLRPEEICLLKNTKPNFGLGELKINIDSGNGSGMKINVQIQNLNEENPIDETKVKNETNLPISESQPIELIVIEDEHPQRFKESNVTVPQ